MTYGFSDSKHAKVTINGRSPFRHVNWAINHVSDGTYNYHIMYLGESVTVTVWDFSKQEDAVLFGLMFK